MKRKSWHIGLVAVIVLLCIVIAIVNLQWTQPMGADPSLEKLVFTNAEFNCANYKQFSPFASLYISANDLYMTYDNSLFCFTNGSFQSVLKYDGAAVALIDGWFYYKTTGSDFSWELYAFNLDTCQTRYVTQLESNHRRDIFCENGDTLYVPTNTKRTSYLEISNSVMMGEVQQNESYQIGEYRYTLEGNMQEKELIRYSSEGVVFSYADIIPYGDKSMIPCQGGLLIHNEGQGDLLYYINGATGDSVELFSVECISSTSAVNVRGDDVYLSLVRYVELGELGRKSDPKDEINGTYRISLINYSIEKLSSHVYTGLYIFNDSGIYASDRDGRVYLLDFDGQLVAELSQ